MVNGNLDVCLCLECNILLCFDFDPLSVSDCGMAFSFQQDIVAQSIGPAWADGDAFPHPCSGGGVADCHGCPVGYRWKSAGVFVVVCLDRGGFFLSARGSLFWVALRWADRGKSRALAPAKKHVGR